MLVLLKIRQVWLTEAGEDAHDHKKKGSDIFKIKYQISRCR